MRLPEFDNRPLLFESTIDSEIPDVQDGYIKTGTQLVDLRQKIRTYYGVPVWRRLDFERTPELLVKLRGFIDEVRGRPYEVSKLEFVKAFFGTNTKTDTQSFFCSELVAEAYIRLGILKGTLHSDNYLPSFFSNELEVYLPLEPGVKLEQEYVMTYACDAATASQQTYLIANGCAPSEAELEASKEELRIEVVSAQGLIWRPKMLGLVEVKLKEEPLLCCEFYLGLPPANVRDVKTPEAAGYDPVWNKSVTLPFVSTGCMVKVMVKDRHLLELDSVLGYAMVELNDLKVGETRELVLKLQQGSLRIVCSRLPAVAPA